MVRLNATIESLAREKRPPINVWSQRPPKNRQKRTLLAGSFFIQAVPIVIQEQKSDPLYPEPCTLNP
jgi:hypothetical protein